MLFLFTTTKQKKKKKQVNAYHHPPIRYGIDATIMFIICGYCSIVAFIQVIMQILIAAGVVDGNSDALKMYGFQEPEKDIDWLLYLTIDLLLCIFSIPLFYIHQRRNNKYKWSRLNIINVEKVLMSTAKLIPFNDNEPSHYLSSIISEDDEDELDLSSDNGINSPSINSLSTQRTMLISAAKIPKLPFFYQFFISCVLLIVSIAAPSVLHIPYFLVVLLVCLGPIIALWASTKPLFHLIGPIYMTLHLMLISIYQVPAVRDAFNDTAADILGLVNLHQQYWSEDIFHDIIKDQHIVPNLVSTIFLISLLWALGLRPILLHASIYKTSKSGSAGFRRPISSSIVQHQPAKGSIGNLFLSPPTSARKGPRASLNIHSGRQKSKPQTYQSLPDQESDPSSQEFARSEEKMDSVGIKKFVPHKSSGGNVLNKIDNEQQDQDEEQEIWLVRYQ